MFILKDEMTSSSPRSRASRSSARVRPAYQPFNIGKWSSVTKASTSSLALDPEEAAELDVKPSTTRVSKTQAQAKGKGKGKVFVKDEEEQKAKTEQEDEDEITGKESDQSDDDEDDDDFAMNSEEEEEQVQRAIKTSAKGMGKAGSSSRGVRKTATKGKTRAVGLNSRALRQAVARVAESEP